MTIVPFIVLSSYGKTTPLRQRNAAVVGVLFYQGELKMNEQVHVRLPNKVFSHCGENLYKCIYNPKLFVHQYTPGKHSYSVLRVVYDLHHWPIEEQVQIDKSPNICESCLFMWGIKLLYQKVYSKRFMF